MPRGKMHPTTHTPRKAIKQLGIINLIYDWQLSQADQSQAKENSHKTIKTHHVQTCIQTSLDKKTSNLT